MVDILLFPNIKIKVTLTCVEINILVRSRLVNWRSSKTWIRQNNSVVWHLVYQHSSESRQGPPNYFRPREVSRLTRENSAPLFAVNPRQEVGRVVLRRPLVEQDEASVNLSLLHLELEGLYVSGDLFDAEGLLVDVGDVSASQWPKPTKVLLQFALPSQ